MIKFKAFSKTLNRWLDPSRIYVNGNGKTLWIHGGIEGHAGDDVVICCYTGLKDRDGNEIYEGHILDCLNDPLEWESETKKVVQWGDASWNLSYDPAVYSVVGHVLEEGVQE